MYYFRVIKTLTLRKGTTKVELVVITTLLEKAQGVLEELRLGCHHDPTLSFNFQSRNKNITLKPHYLYACYQR